MKLTTQQIGKAGELLVQQRLLRRGIESANLTTDSGIDLVAYVQGHAKTIQVKTNERPKPAGGTGGPALDWWVPSTCPADYVALVDLSTDQIWVFTLTQLKRAAQQKPEGWLHIFMRTEKMKRRPKHKRTYTWDFDRYLIERVF